MTFFLLAVPQANPSSLLINGGGSKSLKLRKMTGALIHPVTNHWPAKGPRFEDLRSSMDFLIALRVFAGIYKGYVEERHQTGWRRDCWKRWFSSAELMLKCIWVFQVVRLKISRNESILNISRFPAEKRKKHTTYWGLPHLPMKYCGSSTWAVSETLPLKALVLLGGAFRSGPFARCGPDLVMSGEAMINHKAIIMQTHQKKEPFDT